MKDKKVLHNDRRSNDRMRSKDCRRSSEDRRSDKNKLENSFLDSEGVKVASSRRRVPDRRLNNIQVEWHEDEEDNCA